jgi:hypothetical protein
MTEMNLNFILSVSRVFDGQSNGFSHICIFKAVS